MVPNSIKIRVPCEYVFPHGALYLSADKLVDFDRLREDDNQARDEHGRRIWVVKVMDQDPDAGRFGRSTEAEVKIAADVQPYRLSSSFMATGPVEPCRCPLWPTRRGSLATFRWDQLGRGSSSRLSSCCSVCPTSSSRSRWSSCS
ncbi:hypothetical protein Pme01_50890 [Planosporangium mesophilum]|uniref:Uncharacterized protein n=1 Tax=Planosporangium mesophilum TaxID=689768 RepID=A0A8J3X2H3_9ACTN|nr:hypothetical protein Pme01_50890 [Planosporangium mesophilum]